MEKSNKIFFFKNWYEGLLQLMTDKKSTKQLLEPESVGVLLYRQEFSFFNICCCYIADFFKETKCEII